MIGAGLFLLIIIIVVICCVNRRRERDNKRKYNPSGYQTNRAYMTDTDHVIYDNSGNAGDAYAPQVNGHYEMKVGEVGYENYQYADEDAQRVNHYKESRPHGTSRPVSNIVEGDAFPSPNINNR